MSPDLASRLVSSAGAAVHDRVCNCLDRGFGYTLRSMDLDVIGPAATVAVLRTLAEDARRIGIHVVAPDDFAFLADQIERGGTDSGS